MPRLIIFSGAGLSAESGLATFRGSADGLWENHKIEEVCDITTFRQNYDLVHAFYNARRAQLATVEPNAAHRMIAEWQKRYDTVLLTQNVDDLLERAGCTDVIHLHGFLPEMQCRACGHVWNIGYNAWGDNDRCPHETTRPCRSRNGVKPHVVLFGEHAPRYVDLYRTIDRLKEDDVVLVTGTSEAVIPIGHFLAKRPGFKIFNALEPSVVPHVFAESQIKPATEAFPEIDKIIRLLMT